MRSPRSSGTRQMLNSLARAGISAVDLFLNAVRSGMKTRKTGALAALDFLDLELKAIRTAKDVNEPVAAVYRDRFRHILVDEAQDLNPTAV